jgi:hydrogenase maturation protease
VILVDTVSRGGRPGTLYVIEPDLAEIGAGPAQLDAHALDPMRVLAAAKSLGARFGRILLVGCEPSPETVDPDGEGSMGLSEPVRNALEEAVHVIEELVAKLVGGASRDHPAEGEHDVHTVQQDRRRSGAGGGGPGGAG